MTKKPIPVLGKLAPEPPIAVRRGDSGKSEFERKVSTFLGKIKRQQQDTLDINLSEVSETDIQSMLDMLLEFSNRTLDQEEIDPARGDYIRPNHREEEASRKAKSALGSFSKRVKTILIEAKTQGSISGIREKIGEAIGDLHKEIKGPSERTAYRTRLAGRIRAQVEAISKNIKITMPTKASSGPAKTIPDKTGSAKKNSEGPSKAETAKIKLIHALQLTTYEAYKRGIITHIQQKPCYISEAQIEDLAFHLALWLNSMLEDRKLASKVVREKKSKDKNRITQLAEDQLDVLYSELGDELQSMFSVKEVVPTFEKCYGEINEEAAMAEYTEESIEADLQRILGEILAPHPCTALHERDAEYLKTSGFDEMGVEFASAMVNELNDRFYGGVDYVKADIVTSWLAANAPSGETETLPEAGSDDDILWQTRKLLLCYHGGKGQHQVAPVLTRAFYEEYQATADPILKAVILSLLRGFVENLSLNRDSREGPNEKIVHYREFVPSNVRRSMDMPGLAKRIVEMVREQSTLPDDKADVEATTELQAREAITQEKPDEVGALLEQLRIVKEQIESALKPLEEGSDELQRINQQVVEAVAAGNYSILKELGRRGDELKRQRDTNSPKIEALTLKRQEINDQITKLEEIQGQMETAVAEARKLTGSLMN